MSDFCRYVKALGEEVKLMLWDTAGQEQFHSMTRAYYRGSFSALIILHVELCTLKIQLRIWFHICSGAKAAVLAFSTTDRASFDAIPIWKNKVN